MNLTAPASDPVVVEFLAGVFDGVEVLMPELGGVEEEAM